MVDLEEYNLNSQAYHNASVLEEFKASYAQGKNCYMAIVKVEEGINVIAVPHLKMDEIFYRLGKQDCEVLAIEGEAFYYKAEWAVREEKKKLKFARKGTFVGSKFGKAVEKRLSDEEKAGNGFGE